MRPVRTLTVTIVLAGLLAAGCGGRSLLGKPDKPRAGAATATTAAAGTPATSEPAPATTVGGPATSTWSSRPVVKTSHGGAPGPIQLVHVRVAHHPTYDRVTFEFTTQRPGYRVAYVGKVTQDGSGAPVALQGQAFLSVVFEPAVAHDDAGAPTYRGPRSVVTGYPSLKQVAFAGDFEGNVSWGLGLDDRVGFRVIELDGPPRIAVDVAG
jgi:hypothetical protein